MNILGLRNKKNNVNYIVFLPIDKPLFRWFYFSNKDASPSEGPTENFCSKKNLSAKIGF